MNSFKGDEAMYAIRAYTADKAEEFCSKLFIGPEAFSKANDYFDRLKKLPNVREVSFTRLDGDVPQSVELVKRGIDGKLYSDIPSK